MMHKSKVYIILLISSVFVILGFSIIYTLNAIDDVKSVKPVVYMVMKSIDQNIDFWSAVKEGAEIAGMELEVEVISIGPENETDISSQQKIMMDILKARPQAVVFAAVDYEKMQPYAEKIMDAGITLVTVDSDVKTNYPHIFVATNNIEAAKMAGVQMGKALEGKGKVAIMTQFFASTTAYDRQSGFIEQIKQYPNIEVIGETWDCNSDMDIAYKKTLEILEKYPDVTGIFGSNESSLLGVARAIKDLGLDGKISLIGFDSNEEVVGLIEEGVIDATIVQRPFNMGYMGVKRAIEESNVKTNTNEIIDTGYVLITKDNIYEPENQKLIFPFSK